MFGFGKKNPQEIPKELSGGIPRPESVEASQAPSDGSASKVTKTVTPKLEKGAFKFLDITLILLASLLFTGSTYLYFSDISLRKYLLGWEDEESREPIGKLVLKTGRVRRKGSNQVEFLDLEKEQILFNYDTIVTGAETTAVLRLDDGTEIELGANTMIKLVQASRLGIGGLARSATVNVVAGKVKGKAGSSDVTIKSKTKTVILNQATQSQEIEQKVEALQKPNKKIEITEDEKLDKEESPEELLKEEVSAKSFVKILNPREGSQINIPKQSKTIEKNIKLKWKIEDKPDIPVKVTVYRITQKGPQEVARQNVDIKNGNGAANLKINRPGRYEWVIQNAKQDAPFVFRRKADFSLKGEFRGIRILDPLIGGFKTSSNKFQGKIIKDFNITFRWRKYKGRKDYTIRFFKGARNDKALFERNVNSNRYKINKAKVFSGDLWYEVFTEIEEGFKVTSGKVKFEFDFLPPIPAHPKANAKVTQKQLEREGGKIIFTWQTTNFTDGYQFQVAKTPSFRSTMLNKQLKENYMFLSAPKSGTYYWRVQSFTKGKKSRWSQPQAFTVR